MNDTDTDAFLMSVFEAPLWMPSTA